MRFQVMTKKQAVDGKQERKIRLIAESDEDREFLSDFVLAANSGDSLVDMTLDYREDVAGATMDLQLVSPADKVS